jgi:hypothetical protein
MATGIAVKRRLGWRPNRGAQRILEAAFMKSGDAATSPFEIATRAREPRLTGLVLLHH